jgi:hypothetical protein
VGMLTFTSTDFVIEDAEQIDAYDYARDFGDYLKMLV